MAKLDCVSAASYEFMFGQLSLKYDACDQYLVSRPLALHTHLGWHDRSFCCLSIADSTCRSSFSRADV
jgi:hypothetical protein